MQRKKKVLLIEDVAQSNGGSFKGKPLGSFGDMAIFSFQYNKNITSGEGGLVMTDSLDLYNKANAFHDTGYVRKPDGRVDTDISPVQSWGQCVHMSDLTAALLLAQSEKIDTVCSHMRKINHQLYTGLGKIPHCKVRRVIDPQGDAGNFVLISFPTAEYTRALVKLTRLRGVRPPPEGCANINMHDNWGMHLYYHNVSLVKKIGVNSKNRPWSDPLNSFHSSITYGMGTCPKSDDLFNRSIMLSCPPLMSEETTNQIIQIYTQSAKELEHMLNHK